METAKVKPSGCILYPFGYFPRQGTRLESESVLMNHKTGYRYYS
jgi:hypothetical protein